MKKSHITTIILVLYSMVAQAQHNYELNIEGGALYMQAGANVYVWGDVRLDGATGLLDNDGYLEVQGNFYGENSSVVQTGGGASSTGIVHFNNQDVNGTEDQQIILSNSCNLTGNAAFYDVDLQNRGTNKLVYLNGGNAAVKNTLEFVSGASNRLRTATAGSTTGDTYTNYFGIENTNNAAIVGASSLGTTTSSGYVEGRLRWTVASGTTYNFPVGIQPGSKDGLEGFTMGVTAGSGTVEGAFTTTINYNMVGKNTFCDYGTASTGSVTTADGIMDKVAHSCQLGGEWSATNPVGSVTGYNMTVVPGATLAGECTFLTTTPKGVLRYTSHNGNPNNDADGTASYTSIGLTGTGYVEDPNQYTVNGNTGFSRFGVSGGTAAVLPVDFLYIRATPVENRYIKIDWATATEHNVSHFELERSLNAYDFEHIKDVAAVGNSTTVNTYNHSDTEVEKNTTYYYHVKSVDNDGTFEYSNIVSAKLTKDGSTVLLYPNPNKTGNGFTLDYTTYNASSDLNIRVYNALGQSLLNDTKVLSAGFNRFNIPTEGWTTGYYFFVLTENGETTTVKAEINN